jgi:hypothetical protein
MRKSPSSDATLDDGNGRSAAIATNGGQIRAFFIY